MTLFGRILLCIVVASLCLYRYIDHHNEVTQLRLSIPQLEKEVRQIQEANTKLEYEIDQFESPLNLLQLIRLPEYRHLKHPYVSDILILPSKNSNHVQDNDA